LRGYVQFIKNKNTHRERKEERVATAGAYNSDLRVPGEQHVEVVGIT